MNNLKTNKKKHFTVNPPFTVNCVVAHLYRQLVSQLADRGDIN